MSDKTLKQRLKHVNFRLTTSEKERLETLAREHNRTVSAEVRSLMGDVTHELQTGKLGMSYLNMRPTNTGLPRCHKLDVKLTGQVYDYLKLNCINLTAALVYGIQEH